MEGDPDSQIHLRYLCWKGDNKKSDSKDHQLRGTCLLCEMWLLNAPRTPRQTLVNGMNLIFGYYFYLSHHSKGHIYYILKGDLFLFHFWKYWPFILWIMTRTQNNLIDLLTKINIIYPQFRVPIGIRYDSSHPVPDIWCNIPEISDGLWPSALEGPSKAKLKQKCWIANIEQMKAW